MLMNVSQLGYDLENNVITFKNAVLKQGDDLEIYVPSPISGKFEWIPVQLQWARYPREGWYFISENLEINDFVSTCNPVGLFAKK